MGEVYLAHHAELGTKVAIKLMPPPQAEDVSALRERFAREARLQAAVDHPGVVRVLDCDVFGDRPYLVLEHVSGRSLRDLLADGPVPVAEAVRLCAETADVLVAAHACGVLHRDIKPENVLRADDGRVRVLDFGIARARDGGAPVTRTGEIVGTPQYMAPEQLLDAGDEVDERCDVHALGVLTYELLTGSNPFQGANVFAVLKLVESLVPRPPSTARPEVPIAIDEVVQRALAKERTQRWPTAGAFAAALRAAVDTDAVEGSPRRWPWIAAALLAATAIGAIGASAWSDAPAPTMDRDAVRDAAPASGLTLGRMRLQHGEYHAAIADLEPAGPAARPQACLAWLCAYRVLPLVVDAPELWSDCDELRRRRLFRESRDEDAPEAVDAATAAARLLSRGDAAEAWQMLQPLLALPASTNREHVATLALIAAHAVCRDRRVLRTVGARLSDAEPGVAALLTLRLSPRAGRIAALRDLARRLPAEGPDRWLVELLVAGLAGDADYERARSVAEMAWLQGAGEAAAIWFAGARLRHAHTASSPLGRDESSRLSSLLAGADVLDAPAAMELRKLLESPPVSLATLLQQGSDLDLRLIPTDFLASPEQADTLLNAINVDPASFEAMALRLRAGAEPDATQPPWSQLTSGPMHERWLQEVCGGVQ